MTKQTQQPGPGRSTSDAAFAELKKQVAQRNEQAQKEGRRCAPRVSRNRFGRVAGTTLARNDPLGTPGPVAGSVDW